MGLCFSKIRAFFLGEETMLQQDQQQVDESSTLQTIQELKTSKPPLHSIKIKHPSQELFLTEESLLTIIDNHCADIPHVDIKHLASKIFSSLSHQGVDYDDLEDLIIRSAAMSMDDQPEYSKVSARFLTEKILREMRQLAIHTFSDSIKYGFSVGLIGEATFNFVTKHQSELNLAINTSRSRLFEYFGLKTVYDRYLLKDPISRNTVESEQFFLMRVACGLSQNVTEAIEFYELISKFEYMPATPTLFNSGTKRPQMSSCYLLDSPVDSLESIYDRYAEIAKLSKFAGGIGLSYSRVRARGSLIEGTNGHSNGIIPFLKTLDSSVSAVNQGGKRKGAACVYLEPWHADVYEFLELRENTGDEALRAHNLNLANWIPDLFMRRVSEDQKWSLFDPRDVPHFVDTFGKEFETAYAAAEKQGLAKKSVPARELYGKMMKCLAQTGNGWMCFKDASNTKGNQTLKSENVIHLSNLCTEILEVTSDREIAVCNLGSINLALYVEDGKFNFEKMAKNARLATKYLDRVIDINFYPVPKASSSNSRWRPVGLGAMGLQDVFFRLGIPFDSKEAKELSKQIQAEIYFNALKTSCELAKEFGPHENYQDTRAAKGQLQPDLWGIEETEPRWIELKADIAKHGLRNSLLIAIAPTATIASIVGSYECIEPQVSNLFKRETLSGEFLQINPYLVRDLRKMGLWNSDIKDKIKLGEGSIQAIEEIPAEMREIYRTAWEVPMRSLIDMASERGPYIDQSQSLNLFMESPTIGKLSSMYLYAWQKGIKTSYYLRSRPATRINKTTVSQNKIAGKPSVKEMIACSLENPETCESCT